ncbi:MAG: magnesium/cobalt transporter CorA [Deltaproteobacteria bacterium]|jgi:magnesium transporter|nr:magnesium/cobalt transporter CorA [Deltaproteobacteria bacterium]
MKKKKKRKRLPFGFRHSKRINTADMPQSNNESPEKMEVQIIGYNQEMSREYDTSDMEMLKKIRSENDIIWINFSGNLEVEIFKKVSDFFKLHSLAVEDALSVYQRPKIEEYKNFIYLVSRVPDPLEENPTTQISFFMGKGFVISVQERKNSCFDATRNKLLADKGKVRIWSEAYLLFLLYDSVVMQYFHVVTDLGDKLSHLENQIINKNDTGTLAETHYIKSEMYNLRRIIFAMRETIQRLTSEEYEDYIDLKARLYFRDCADHLYQLLDLVDYTREWSASTVELHMSNLSNHMNEVMKMLTLIATIFIPLSFIAGFYGMNFNPEKSVLNMPELNWKYGYPFAIFLMLLTVGIMTGYFFHKGWIGNSEKKKDLKDDDS